MRAEAFSDFTDTGDLGVTIAGVPFPHRLYQFALAHSGWRRADVVDAELRLPTMKRLAAELCDQSDREGWSGRQLLERLFEHELAEREVRRYER